MCERRVTRARANAEGEYCSAEAAARMRLRVAAATGYSATGWRTRETVVIETPTRRATSLMLATAYAATVSGHWATNTWKGRSLLLKEKQNLI